MPTKKKSLVDSILSHPVYTTKLPSNGKAVKYRPYTVGEQKQLLIAMQTSDGKLNSVNTMTHLIDSCIVDGDFSTKDNPIVDVEYMFMKMRAVSVGEIIEVLSQCKQCKDKNQISVDISKCEVENLNNSGTVKLSDNVAVQLRYPTIYDVDWDSDTNSPDAEFDLIAKCMDCIHHGDNSYKVGVDLSSEDVKEFLSKLLADQYKEIEEFFKNTPKLYYKVEYTCKNEECKAKNEAKISGIEDFFG